MDIALLPKQMEFLTCEAEECALVSGIGYGKSSAGSLFVINETALTPNIPGLIVASTYSQLTSATLANLQYWCEMLGIYYKYNSSTKLVTINQTQHFVRSAEQYNNSRGLESGFLWVDEAAYVSEAATDMFIGRIRHKGGSLKKRFTSTPNGYNSFYHKFSPEGDNYHPSRVLLKAKTESNFFLPESYIANLRRSYSSKMAAQELDADFISLAGLGCYSDFDRKKHVKPCRNIFTNSPAQQLYIVADWNLDPLTAVVGFMEGGTMYIIDEIYLEGGSDIRMLAKEIKKRYSAANPLVIGDGTGNSRRSILNIKQTAYGILNEEGLRTVAFTNPHVAKRLGNVNRLFYHNLAVVDPSCKRLIKDLELVQYAKSGNDIDKTSNKKITHISDALGYMCWKLNSFIQQPKSRSYDI